jgi:tetratricopeptide (TPR) repeat protein/DNA-binding winged helix-turn-helix (wHTH) protein
VHERRLPLDDGYVDLATGEVVRSGGAWALSDLEVRLLAHLAGAPGLVSPRALLVEVWGYAPTVRSRAVVAAVHRLRARLEPDPASPRHLVSTRRGYTFVPSRPKDEAGGEAAAAVRALLQAGPGAVVGPPGVGKTRLARRLVQERAGVLVELPGARDLAHARHLLAAAVEVPDAGAPDFAERLGRALLARGSPLVVLDGVDGLDDAALAALAAPLPRWACTARRAPAGVSAVSLGPLPPDEARALVHAARPELAPDAVEWLVDRVGGLPLALLVAVGRLAWLPFSAWPALLPGVLARDEALGSTVDAALEPLAPDARRALAAAAAVPRPLSVPQLVALAGLPHAGGVEGLVARSLLALDGERVALLPALAGRVRERLGGLPLDDWAAAEAHQLAEGWSGLAPAVRADTLENVLAAADGPRGATVLAALARVGRLVLPPAGVRALERWARDAADPIERALLVAWRAGLPAPPDWVGPALDAAAAVADPAAWAQVSVRRAQRRRFRGELAEAVALVDDALRDPRAAGPRAHLLVERAMGARRRGDLAAAAADLAEASAHLPPDAPWLEVRLVGTRGMVLGDLGRSVEAEALLRRALELAEAQGDPENAQILLGNLAGFALGREDLAESARLVRRALALQRRTGQRRGEAVSLTNLGLLELVRGDLGEAEALLVRARLLHEGVGDPLALGHTVGVLGRLYHVRGAVEAADRAYTEADALQGAGLGGALVRLLQGILWFGDGRAAAAGPRCAAASAELAAVPKLVALLAPLCGPHDPAVARRVLGSATLDAAGR